MKVECKKCGDVLHANGFVPFTTCKCGGTFVDGLGVKDRFRYGGQAKVIKI